jgi:transposase
VLERPLGLDSTTSSKLPTSKGLKKSNQIRTKSLREKGKRASGGLKGHPGQRLQLVLQPENMLEHPTPCSCLGCGCDICVVVAKK